MRTKVIEQITLLVSVVKWTCYASVVGVLVGFGTAAFLWALAWTSGQLSRCPDYYLLLPVIAQCYESGGPGDRRSIGTKTVN